MTCSIDGCHRKNHGKWCKPKPVCSVEGCTSTNRITRGWCSKHYQRWIAHGDVNAPIEDRIPNVGNCSVEGCDEPMRKRSWCAGHYANWKRTGEEPKAFTYRWANETHCLVCGETNGNFESRQFCSARCKMLHHRGSHKESSLCNICGEVFSLFEVGQGGRKKRIDSLTCSECRRPGHLRQHVPALRQRDGDDCGLCEKPIDFTLSHPHPMSRSVDHVIPWAKGGKNELQNYQLSHLVCNTRRRDMDIKDFKEVFV